MGQLSTAGGQQSHIRTEIYGRRQENVQLINKCILFINRNVLLVFKKNQILSHKANKSFNITLQNMTNSFFFSEKIVLAQGEMVNSYFMRIYIQLYIHVYPGWPIISRTNEDFLNFK